MAPSRTAAAISCIFAVPWSALFTWPTSIRAYSNPDMAISSTTIRQLRSIVLYFDSVKTLKGWKPPLFSAAAGAAAWTPARAGAAGVV